MKWKYGNSWERFPIKEGEIWAAGPHKLMCGSVIQNDIDNLLSEKVDMIYVDPPYNTSALNSFMIKAKLKKHYEFTEFISCVIDTCKQYCDGVIYMEMGRQNIAEVNDLILKKKGVILGLYNTTYYQKHHCHLIRFTFKDAKPINETADGLDDGETPFWAVYLEKKYNNVKTILDPCIGRGLTGRVAENYGLQCYGMELNKRRLANLLEWYHNQGLKIERI